MNKTALKAAVAVVVYFLIVYLIRISMNFYFYNIALHTLFSLVVSGVILIVLNRCLEKLINIKLKKFVLSGVLLGGFLIMWLFTTTMYWAYDPFNERLQKYDAIVDTEFTQGMSNVVGMRQTLLYPKIDGNYVYAQEVTLTQPIFFAALDKEHDFDSFETSVTIDGITVNYFDNGDWIFWRYDVDVYRVYGYMQKSHYTMDDIEIIKLKS